MVDEQLKIRSPKPFSIGFADFKIELKKGEYAVPLFQRNFVWTPSKICKLMDSIYRYYPIGSFLIWKTKEKSLFKKSEDFIGYENHDYIKYILDGQQRMISLSIVLFGKLVTPIKKKHHLEPNNFCLDMRKVLQKEDSVFVYMDEKPDEIRYFSLYKILNEEYINDYGDLEIELDEKKIEEAYSDKTVDKNEIKKNLINCQKHFENYKFSIIEIDDSEIPSQKNRAKYIERMCDSFIRVNNQGTKLTTVNLVMASLFDENFNLQEEFSKFKKSLGSNFSDIPDEVILQTIALLLKNNISKSTMLNLKSREIKDEWENIKKSFKQALDKLETKFKVKNIKFLPYPIMVSILSGFYFSSKFNDFLPEQKKLLERWFWKSSFSGRFSGRGFFDNIISDKKKFDTLGKITFGERKGNNKEKIKIFVKEKEKAYSLDEDIHMDFGSLKKDLMKTRYTQKSSLNGAMFCLFSQKKVLDLDGGEEINLGDAISDLNKKENHHIFPLSKFRGKKMVNSIMNICFLSKKVNNFISDKEPLKYFSKYQSLDHFKDAMKSLYIPLDAKSGIWNNNFEAFLKSRTDVVISEIEKLTGMKSNIEEDIENDGQKLIRKFEVKLRDFIDTKMTTVYGTYWWKQAPGGVKKEAKEEFERKKRKDPLFKDSEYTSRWGRNWLNLTNLDHLRQIITAHWTRAFKDSFRGSPEKFSHSFDYIRNLRNFYSHDDNEEPEEGFKDSAMGALKTFNRILKFSD